MLDNATLQSGGLKGYSFGKHKQKAHGSFRVKSTNGQNVDVSEFA